MEYSKKFYRQSEIKTFLKCGKLYEFVHIKGLRVPPSGALTLGTAIHSGANYNLAQKVNTGEDLPIDTVEDVFSDSFESLKDDTDWGEDDPGKIKDSGVAMIHVHHENIAPLIKPKTVEETFHVELNDRDYGLTGTIDVTEESGVIEDLKTSKGFYKENSIEKSFQPAMYDFAYESLHGTKSTGFRFDVLIKPTKTLPPRVQQVQSTVTNSDRLWLFTAIDQVHKAIQAGVFLPAPEGAWYCSEKWCGFWAQCKGKK